MKALILFYFLLVLSSLQAAVTVVCRDSHPNVNDARAVRFAITNATASKIYYCHSVSGAPALTTSPTGQPDYTLTGFPSKYTATQIAGSSYNQASPTYSIGLDPGATGFISIGVDANYVGPSPYAAQSAIMNVTVPFFVSRDDKATWEPVTHYWSDTVNWSASFSGTGFPSGSTIVFGTYTWTGASPDIGSVEVKPKTAGWVKVTLGATVLFEQEVKAGQSLYWETNSPYPYFGQRLKVVQDGVTYYDIEVTNMREGAVSPETGLPLEGYEFTYVLEFEAQGQPVDEESGVHHAADPPEISRINPPPDAPANTVQGQYSGRSPGSPGVDAKTNTTAPDTTKEMYEAVRQGAEDALNGNAGIDGNVAKAEVGNAKGTALGNAFVGGFGALQGAASVALPSVGYATVSSMEVPFIFGQTLVLGVPAWAYLIKWFCSAITVIFGLVTFVKIIRSIFV